MQQTWEEWLNFMSAINGGDTILMRLVTLILHHRLIKVKGTTVADSGL